MERVQLAEALLGDDDDDRDGDEAAVEAAWAAEVEQRIARLEMAQIYAALE